MLTAVVGEGQLHLKGRLGHAVALGLLALYLVAGGALHHGGGLPEQEGAQRNGELHFSNY